MERWALTSFEMRSIHGTVRRESVDCIWQELSPSKVSGACEGGACEGDLALLRLAVEELVVPRGLPPAAKHRTPIAGGGDSPSSRRPGRASNLGRGTRTSSEALTHLITELIFVTGILPQYVFAVPPLPLVGSMHDKSSWAYRVDSSLPACSWLRLVSTGCKD